MELQGWHGSLNLEYGKREDATVVLSSQNKAPLKVQRPFYPEGNEVCHSVILHTAGGVVGGDRLSIDLHLRPETSALITTAAASKVYRSKGLLAKQNINIKVEEGACLEWLPQPLILFDAANYRQDLIVELAPGSSWLGWEIIRFGRSARGERFLEGKWRSHTEFWRENRPLWIDRQRLDGGEKMLESPLGLAGCSIAGSLVWIGQPARAEIVEKTRSLWEATSGASSREGQLQAGVTRLPEGILCRYRGNSIADVTNWFMAVWHQLRLSFLGRPSCRPRVW
ncbi:MAG: urease accessory protein UreD [Cyanobacteriota bacterium]|nr:urease accessory protein UreD [Cyanobacteriota bacterium]